MDNEYYQIEAVFEVAMTEHNYERGNLYMQTEFHSYKQSMPKLTVARSGFLEPKGSFMLTLRDLIRMVPFSSYFFSYIQTEQVTIRIFEKFENASFGIESVSFLVPNEALQFKSAHLRVKTVLYGVRWLMEDWFFSFALMCILTLTFWLSVTIIVAILILKRLYLLKWL